MTDVADFPSANVDNIRGSIFYTVYSVTLERMQIVLTSAGIDFLRRLVSSSDSHGSLELILAVFETQVPLQTFQLFRPCHLKSLLFHQNIDFFKSVRS